MNHDEERSDFPRVRPRDGFPGGFSLTAKDLADFLKDLAGLYSQDRTGNRELSIALAKLSRVLRRHSDKDLPTLLDDLTITEPARKRSGVRHRVSRFAERDMSSLSIAEFKQMIYDPGLTREDLMILAGSRLGIPRSQLQRLGRDGIINVIETTLRNSDALDIISEEASRTGWRRSR